MKKTSIYLLRDNLASYLNEFVKTGESIVIEKYKKPLVVISPSIKKKTTVDFKKYFGFLGGGETGKEFVNRVRRNKREREYVRLLRKGIMK